MYRTAVPKTAIHKYHQAPRSKRKIGTTWQSLMSPPAGHTMLTKYPNECQLSPFIFPALNGRHDG